MCGIAGFMNHSGSNGSARLLTAMASTIMHRGPDDAGVWMDPTQEIGLAHRRLSILDLSEAGHQPMHSASGRYVIAFNGEIYNHLHLRGQLSGQSWRGSSDTETLLAAIEQWDIPSTLKKCVGMYAFALWDQETRTLTLARDRLGEKPLYYGWQNGVLLFGSELKALKAHPAFKARISRASLTLFLRHNAIPAPYTIYEDIHKLPPGSYWQYNEARSRQGELETYWSVHNAALEGQRKPFIGSDADAAAALEAILVKSTTGQMLADVPLGAFLSGGIDSSTIVALMQAHSATPVKTFTIGFHETGYDEASHARAVAQYLGTEHTELYIKPEAALSVIPQLPDLYDEPFSDSSQIPTYLLSRMAHQEVKVALSGDGGDELFGGYNRHFWVPKLWQRLGWLPYSLRAALAGVLTNVSPTAWDSVFNQLGRWLPSSLQYASPGAKLHKLADTLAAKSPEEIYWSLISHWKQPQQVVKQGIEPATILTAPDRLKDIPDLAHRMMYLDTVTYLPDDILTKVDRAAMGVSLETRVPLLDHRVLEFAWTLPLSMKLRHNQGKWLLRQVLYRHVPKDLIERPKMGFAIPLDVWLRGPLKGWSEDLLNTPRLEREGYFNAHPIQQKWEEHQSGQRNWSYELWDILMFQAWNAS